MPRAWKKEHAAVWASLPPEAKQIVSQRETEVRGVLSRVGTEVNAYRQNKPIVDAVEPYKPYLEQVSSHLGKHPANLINDVLRFEHTLRTAQSNDERLGVLSEIVSEYGIDISGFVDPQTIERIAGQREGALQQELDNLRREVGALRNERQERLRAAHQTQTQAVQRHISDFASNTKEYPHFAKVRADMVGILQTPGVDDAGKTPAQLLKEAYDKACWAHPEIRPQLVQAEAARQREAAEREAREKAQRADRASGVNVRGGTPSPSKRSLDATLNSVADKFYR
jgi:hypothetical protein